MARSRLPTLPASCISSRDLAISMRRLSDVSLSAGEELHIVQEQWKPHVSLTSCWRISYGMPKYASARCQRKSENHPAKLAVDANFFPLLNVAVGNRLHRKRSLRKAKEGARGCQPFNVSIGEVACTHLALQAWLIRSHNNGRLSVESCIGRGMKLTESSGNRPMCDSVSPMKTSQAFVARMFSA